MMTILKGILGRLLMAYLRKNAAHLIVDVFLKGLEKGAGLTKTNWDNEEVARLKENRAHYEAILKGEIDHLI